MESGINFVSLAESFGNLGAFALVAWLVRHTFSHTIPRLAADFRDAIAEQRKEFVAELRRIDGEQNVERREMLTRLDALTHEISALRVLIERIDTRIETRRSP